MRKLVFLITLLLFPVLCCSSAGTSGAQVLKIGVFANSSALGGSGAVSSGAESLSLNPAGLVVEKSELKLSQTLWILDIKYSNFAYAHKMNFGTIGLGINYLSVPAIEKYDNTGTKQSESYSPADTVVTLGYANNLDNNLSLGGSLKYISSRIDDASASAVALDVGLQKRIPEYRLKTGLVIQNIGTEIKFNEEGDPLPLNVKFGGKYAIPINCEVDESVSFKQGISIFTDLNLTNDSGFYSNMGLEYLNKFDKSLATRFHETMQAYLEETLIKRADRYDYLDEMEAMDYFGIKMNGTTETAKKHNQIVSDKKELVAVLIETV